MNRNYEENYSRILEELNYSARKIRKISGNTKMALWITWYTFYQPDLKKPAIMDFETHTVPVRISDGAIDENAYMPDFYKRIKGHGAILIDRDIIEGTEEMSEDEAAETIAKRMLERYLKHEGLLEESRYYRS
ncbi:MAG TPA: hypothetical protein DGX96_03955 [Lachnospiraceae bacterium]|jgi:hypothetical protein|nr:hypothetical protein [Lachnospiraceae bacterium]